MGHTCQAIVFQLIQSYLLIIYIINLILFSLPELIFSDDFSSLFLVIKYIILLASSE